MNYVLITVQGGLIDRVRFLHDIDTGLASLRALVEGMDLEEYDAALYGPEGLIANVKSILDNPDESQKSCEERPPSMNPERIYIPFNPVHPLGPMVAGYDDPMGYRDPAEAVFELGQLRKDAGNHLILCEVIPLKEPVTEKSRIEAYSEENDVEDFPYDLVEEYLF